jgi:hypothetical protein
MNDNIKIGADINAGDGGYSLGTQEKYDEFVRGRNQSLGKMRIEELMYRAGLTAQGCWDEMDDYDKQAIEKFAQLIVRECIDTAFHKDHPDLEFLLKHFGVEE